VKSAGNRRQKKKIGTKEKRPFISFLIILRLAVYFSLSLITGVAGRFAASSTGRKQRQETTSIIICWIAFNDYV
jgi:hypothetical protein